MAGNCCSTSCLTSINDKSYRRVLWAALVINAVMFLAELCAGLVAHSASLQADALDFLSDAANYGISLLVVVSHIARAENNLPVMGRIPWQEELGFWYGTYHV